MPGQKAPGMAAEPSTAPSTAAWHWGNDKTYFVAKPATAATYAAAKTKKKKTSPKKKTTKTKKKTTPFLLAGGGRVIDGDAVVAALRTRLPDTLNGVDVRDPMRDLAVALSAARIGEVVATLPRSARARIKSRDPGLLALL